MVTEVAALISASVVVAIREVAEDHLETRARVKLLQEYQRAGLLERGTVTAVSAGRHPENVAEEVL